MRAHSRADERKYLPTPLKLIPDAWFQDAIDEGARLAEFDRAGFYSYQWLENLVGCEVRNAETVHPEWEARVGEALVLHPDPKAPRLQIVGLEAGHHVVAYAGPDQQAQALGKPWATASWLFFLEPLGEDRCRFVSRYRASCSEDLATRLSFGPTLLEPVGFAMDRRMLLGVKDRAETAGRASAS